MSEEPKNSRVYSDLSKILVFVSNKSAQKPFGSDKQSAALVHKDNFLQNETNKERPQTTSWKLDP